VQHETEPIAKRRCDWSERNPKEARNPQSEGSRPWPTARASGFGFVSDFRSRISGFGIASICVALSLALALTGCHSLGPRTVARDRSDYSGSIAESWKRQTLLNIVKLRYLDPPIFVDVGQIVAGYSLETALTAGGVLPENANFGGDTVTLGGSVRYTDRPTITYTPLTGNKFVKGLVTPLQPESVFFMIQSGWPADGVLFAAVASINGLKNQETSIGGVSAPDSSFLRVLALMRKIQLSGAVAMRIKQDAQKQQTTILTFRSKDIPQATLDDIHELRRLLRLDPEAEELKLVFGATPANDKEVAMLTRSMMQLMATMSSQVDVPTEDISQGRAPSGWESISNNTNAVRMIQIHCASTKPADAFVSIRYRNHWFWIDDRDLKSKRVFSFMLMLFTLADTGEKENLPLITIPAQ
jgi:hypothetical protein